MSAKTTHGCAAAAALSTLDHATMVQVRSQRDTELEELFGSDSSGDEGAGKQKGKRRRRPEEGSSHKRPKRKADEGECAANIDMFMCGLLRRGFVGSCHIPVEMLGAFSSGNNAWRCLRTLAPRIACAGRLDRLTAPKGPQL
jgi:hypothetical protein